MADLETIKPVKTKKKTAAPMLPAVEEGRVRAVIDAVIPTVNEGDFPAKGIAGEPFHVEAHCFTDGHDALRVMLRWRAEGDKASTEVEMKLRWNDEWLASFAPPSMGRYVYAVEAWVDHFRSWRTELARRVDAEDIRSAALVGAELIDHAAWRAKAGDKKALKDWATQLRKDAKSGEPEALKAYALHAPLAEVADRYPDRSLSAKSPELPLFADRERAGFSSWYELFPRSTSNDEGRHGTFADVEARLPYVASMGFDVLYFPPIHPVGREKRKGRNNAVNAEPGDVGSPWAIGAAEGGHKDVLPELGTLEDFRRLVAKANAFGLEIAMDIAFQCAPDHPYVKQHPEWFRWRPDGTVQYAENPPKKYQDIYPFNFETDDWRALWAELKSVFDFWIGYGVKIFRVDNPHTKAFPFWTWCVDAIKRENPDVLFLAEAFTRPKVMHRLAKLGYSQSYTYFAWRNTKEELTDYFTELAHGPGAAYFRPNVWPNTPDILNEHLHGANAAQFKLRLLLAATLSASYGIYGPGYELLDGTPVRAGSEEYLDSEKYQVRRWTLDQPQSIRPFIAQINAIRRENKALQANDSLVMCEVDNDRMMAWAKRSPDGSNVILVVANLDPNHAQYGWVGIDPKALGIDTDRDYLVQDLLGGAQYTWHGTRNYVRLDPGVAPAHIFRVSSPLREEQAIERLG